MKTNLVLFFSKHIGGFLQKRGQGTSLPGYLALRACPDILTKLKYPEGTIVITGTNGKTTVTNLVAESLGKDVVSNRDGANMLSGIVTSLIMNSKGRTVKGDKMVLEVDEANLRLIKDKIVPEYIIITNLFEDQAERHGGILKLSQKIRNSIHGDTTLILNGNDPHLVDLGMKLESNQKIYYGVECLREVEKQEECPNCSGKLMYKKEQYGTLGEFECSCGLATPDIKYLAKDVDLDSARFKVDGEAIHMVQDNMYTVYNMMAAISLCKELGVASDFKEYRSIPGRLEALRAANSFGFLNLVKNRVGLEETLAYIERKAEGRPYKVMYAFNNASADGEDMRWIEGVDFDKYIGENVEEFICTGNQGAFLESVLKKKGLGEKVKLLSGVSDYAGERDNLYIVVSYSEMEKTRREFC